MTEEATYEAILKMLHEVLEMQKAQRRDLTALEKKLDRTVRLLQENTTMTTGLAGITALSHGKRLKTKPRPPIE